MGRTYEALERAEKEYQGNRQGTLPAVPEPQAAEPAAPSWQEWAGPAVEGFGDLKTNLLTRYPNGAIRTVLFAGLAQGDGTSTSAINFATSLARDPQLSVLLIDTNPTHPCLHDVFKIDHGHGLPDLVRRNGRGWSPTGMATANLHVIPWGEPHLDPVTFFESAEFDQFLKRMRDIYDYVVLDAPPVHASSECRVLCSKVDGVVLVIRSGKARRQVALTAKKQLEDAGGRILGVVLNGRRYYIPKFIYKRV